MRRAVFLDRDGVLNHLVLHHGRGASPRALAEFALLPGVAAVVESLRRAGLLAIVVTNQPDVARGAVDPYELSAMHERLQHAVPLDAIYVCPHDDADACACRKPKPGLLHRAAHHWQICLRHSWMVGDSWKDIEAGASAGCMTIQIVAGQLNAVRPAPNFVVPDLAGAGQAIFEELSRSQGALRTAALEGRQTR